MARLIFIVGGARSGKSRFAQRLAQEVGGHDVLFVATATPGDDEMLRRIAIHQRSRPAEWSTCECSSNVAVALAQRNDRHSVLLIDCMTLLVSNVLLACGDPPDPDVAESRVDNEVKSLLEYLKKRSGTAILISGEVGLGLVPETALGRLYRDVLGWTNQAIAECSDDVYWMITGVPVEISSLGTTLQQAAAKCNTLPRGLTGAAKEVENQGRLP